MLAHLETVFIKAVSRVLFNLINLLTLTVLLVVLPGSSVDRAVSELAFAVSVFFAVFELPSVSGIVFLAHHSLAVWFEIVESTIIVNEVSFDNKSGRTRVDSVAEPTNEDRLVIPLDDYL